jgi:hypothetical protein
MPKDPKTPSAEEVKAQAGRLLGVPAQNEDDNNSESIIGESENPETGSETLDASVEKNNRSIAPRLAQLGVKIRFSVYEIKEDMDSDGIQLPPGMYEKVSFPDYRLKGRELAFLGSKPGKCVTKLRLDRDNKSAVLRYGDLEKVEVDFWDANTLRAKSEYKDSEGVLRSKSTVSTKRAGVETGVSEGAPAQAVRGSYYGSEDHGEFMGEKLERQKDGYIAKGAIDASGLKGLFDADYLKIEKGKNTYFAKRDESGIYDFLNGGRGMDQMASLDEGDKVTPSSDKNQKIALEAKAVEERGVLKDGIQKANANAGGAKEAPRGSGEGISAKDMMAKREAFAKKLSDPNARTAYAAAFVKGLREPIAAMIKANPSLDVNKSGTWLRIHETLMGINKDYLAYHQKQNPPVGLAQADKGQATTQFSAEYFKPEDMRVSDGMSMMPEAGIVPGKEAEMQSKFDRVKTGDRNPYYVSKGSVTAEELRSMLDSPYLLVTKDRDGYYAKRESDGFYQFLGRNLPKGVDRQVSLEKGEWMMIRNRDPREAYMEKPLGPVARKEEVKIEPPIKLAKRAD